MVRINKSINDKINKKISNEKAQVGDILLLAILTLIIFYYLMGFIAIEAFFRAENMLVDFLNQTTSSVSLQGIFTSEEYDELESNLARIYCSNITLSLKSSVDSITDDERKTVIADLAIDKAVEALKNEGNDNPTNADIREELKIIYGDDIFDPPSSTEDIETAKKNLQENITSIIEKYPYDVEQALKDYMCEYYYNNGEILNRSLKQGDYLNIKAWSDNETLFGQILSRDILLRVVNNSHTNVKLNASSGCTILVDGEFTGTQVLSNLLQIYENSYNLGIDENKYIPGMFILKNYQYKEENGEIKYNTLDNALDLPQYNTTKEEKLNYILIGYGVALNSDGSYTPTIQAERIQDDGSTATENVYDKLKNLMQKQPGESFWINPNATYRISYQSVGQNYISGGGTGDTWEKFKEALGDTGISLANLKAKDNAGSTIDKYKKILVIEEIID